MTLEEAIAHCLEVAEDNETKALRIGRQYEGTLLDREAKECRRCAADHRQLAEWLTELKEARSIIDACNILAVDALAVEKLCKELKEAKRLLKAAVEDFAVYGALKDLSSEQRIQNPDWRRFNRVFDVLDHQWRYADEALKLMGDELNGI